LPKYQNMKKIDVKFAKRHSEFNNRILKNYYLKKPKYKRLSIYIKLIYE